MDIKSKVPALVAMIIPSCSGRLLRMVPHHWAGSCFRAHRPIVHLTLTLINFRIYVGEDCEAIFSKTALKVHLRRQEVQVLYIQHHLVLFLTSTWAPSVPALTLTLQAPKQIPDILPSPLTIPSLGHPADLSVSHASPSSKPHSPEPSRSLSPKPIPPLVSQELCLFPSTHHFPNEAGNVV